MPYFEAWKEKAKSDKVGREGAVAGTSASLRAPSRAAGSAPVPPLPSPPLSPPYHITKHTPMSIPYPLWLDVSGTTICCAMWPFKAQADVSELREEVSTLTRQLKGLKLDLDDLWDRFNRLSGRLAKRAAREDTAEDVPSREGAELTTPLPALSPTFSKLTARQQQLQMEILRRRGANGGP